MKVPFFDCKMPKSYFDRCGCFYARDKVDHSGRLCTNPCHGLLTSRFKNALEEVELAQVKLKLIAENKVVKDFPAMYIAIAEVQDLLQKTVTENRKAV